MAAGHSINPAGWQAALDVLLGRIAGRFTGWNPAGAGAFVRGLLVYLPHKELLDDQPGAVCADHLARRPTKGAGKRQGVERSPQVA